MILNVVNRNVDSDALLKGLTDVYHLSDAEETDSTMIVQHALSNLTKIGFECQFVNEKRKGYLNKI